VVPSIYHENFSPEPHPASRIDEDFVLNLSPNAFRWNSFSPDHDGDWISSQKLVAQSGDPSRKSGLAYLIYAASKDMAPNTAFFSSDGDYLIVPQAGTLDIQTELGNLLVRPNEIAIIPRGFKYRVTLPEGTARGYICELFEGHFQLPELGPIGSCSLANARDFQIPTARFDGSVENGIAHTRNAGNDWLIVTKFAGKFFRCKQDQTPFDIAAWHGTYYPYKYDLGRYSVLGSVLYDHPDPSIFTVLTAPSSVPGTAIIDFAIFPPRWLVMEDTYWPPYYHRNTMSEFAGAIVTNQDPDFFFNKGLDFMPFGAAFNSTVVPHGMDKNTHEHARSAELKPEKVGMEGFMVFLFESEAAMGVTNWASEAAGQSTSYKGKKPKL
jgi:homogentisate 1,2-dioxygenase